MLRISLYACSNEIPVAQARDGVRAAAAAHHAHLFQRLAVGNQEVGFLADDREAGRHHADHGPGAVVGGDRQVEHVPAAAKAPLPEFVAQHDHRLLPPKSSSAV